MFLKAFFLRVIESWDCVVKSEPFTKGENSGHDQIGSICRQQIETLLKWQFTVFDRVENTGGKGENAGYQHFLLFPHCFPEPSYLASLKIWIVWLRVKSQSMTYTD